ncbi:MAG: hypothetical protein JW724_04205 [Candidatus Altiarchaeota archaeon]|nr:hypothetical protein [Candidatus Altiarchaeota archaeon]
MICHKCGKNTVKMGLCPGCFLKDNPIKMKDISIPVCGCGRFFYRADWKQGIEKAVKGIVEENIEADSEIEIKDILVEPVFEEKNIRVNVKVIGACRGEDFTGELTGRIKKENRVCPFCSRIRSSYYEAVLQFRAPVNARRVLDPKYVMKTGKAPVGFDAYVTSANYAKKLAKDYAKKGFEIKKSSKLVGKKDGKDLYRLYISIKPPGFKAGDILEHKGRLLQVLEAGRAVKCRDLGEGKTVSIPAQQLKEAEKVAGREDARKAMVSAVTPDHIQLMDQETYETFEVSGVFEGVGEADEVGYVVIKGTTYLIE